MQAKSEAMAAAQIESKPQRDVHLHLADARALRELAVGDAGLDDGDAERSG
ncbi:hypothetical protein [Thiohalocapsa halophila]|uniref:hypothetical protein n=1 Tax=Thiohalocapsa halophila TaxID=69359 RepID=UPI001905DEE3|nr:hypothetical protein [Thiohalocapsa halophila]